MATKQLEKQIVSLYNKRKTIDEEIKKLQNQLVQELCPKEKQECEPEYCTFRLTDTCPFIKEWRKILEEARVPENTVPDLLFSFVEKLFREKGLSEKGT